MLLKKDGFAWTPEATSAFDVLKHPPSTALVLHLLDFDKPFIVDVMRRGRDLGWFSIKALVPSPSSTAHLRPTI
jgi:hypothetical protein